MAIEEERLIERLHEAHRRAHESHRATHDAIREAAEQAAAALESKRGATGEPGAESPAAPEAG